MNLKSYVFLLLVVTLSGCAQEKLIVKSDSKERIKLGMPVHITRLGETYPLNRDCKSTCKECDPLFKSWDWYLDSISHDYLILRHDEAFTYDTLTQKEFKIRTRNQKKLYLDAVLAIDKQPMYIYKIPTVSHFDKIPYDSMQVLTFSYKKECYRGGPFQRLFANPNKIRRVSMKDAEIKIKKP